MSLGLGTCHPPCALRPLSAALGWHLSFCVESGLKGWRSPNVFSVLQIQVSSGWWRTVTHRSISTHLSWGQHHLKSRGQTSTSLPAARSLSFFVAAVLRVYKCARRMWGFFIYTYLYVYVMHIYVCMHEYGKIAISGKSRLKTSLISWNRSRLKSLRIHCSGTAGVLCPIGSSCGKPQRPRSCKLWKAVDGSLTCIWYNEHIIITLKKWRDKPTTDLLKRKHMQMHIPYDWL